MGFFLFFPRDFNSSVRNPERNAEHRRGDALRLIQSCKSFALPTAMGVALIGKCCPFLATASGQQPLIRVAKNAVSFSSARTNELAPNGDASARELYGTSFFASRRTSDRFSKYFRTAVRFDCMISSIFLWRSRPCISSVPCHTGVSSRINIRESRWR
jgi:hypothetical protein